MIIQVQGRKLRVRFRHDKVYAVKRMVFKPSTSPVDAYFLDINKTRKQSMQFIEHPVWHEGDHEKAEYWFRVDELPNGVIPKRKRTTAFIEDISDTKDPKKFPRVQGAAVCNPRDSFSKEKGRKIALAKALAIIDLMVKMDYPMVGGAIPSVRKRVHRKWRTKFWKEYFRLRKIESCLAKRRKKLPARGLAVEFVDPVKAEAERKRLEEECKACGACFEKGEGTETQ